MKVGDLVAHKNTGTLGMVLEILDCVAGQVYNIRWLDHTWHSAKYNSHFIKELEVTSASQ